MKKIAYVLAGLLTMLLVFTFYPAGDNDAIVEQYLKTSSYQASIADREINMKFQELRETVIETGKIEVGFPLRVRDNLKTFVTSEFGIVRRIAVYNYEPRTHLGLDLAVEGNPTDIEVISATPGVVQYSGAQRDGDGNLTGAGYYVKVLDTRIGLVFVYMHLAEDSSLEVGQPLEIGDKIGIMGNTGSSSNVHLHFEIRASGVPGFEESVDPSGGNRGRIHPLRNEYLIYRRDTLPKGGLFKIGNYEEYEVPTL